MNANAMPPNMPPDKLMEAFVAVIRKQKAMMDRLHATMKRARRAGPLRHGGRLRK